MLQTSVNCKIMFSTLQGMRKEARFPLFETVRASAQKLKIDDSKLPRKRKVPSCYDKEEPPVESVSTVEEHKFFVK